MADNTDSESMDNPDSTYWHYDPDTNPFLVGTRVSSFGGKQDYKSGQDDGQFYYGGGSYDPVTDQESKENYAAVDPAWYDKGILKPGDTFDVYNPSDPDKRVTVVARDRGPGRSTGRGLDLPPHVLNQLGLDTDQEAVMDFSNNFSGKAVNAGPPPKPGETTGEDIRQKIGEQPQSSMLAGDVTKASVQQALKGGPVARNTDGSIDYGGGVSVYPSGIVQIDSGNSKIQWIPGMKTPHIINVNPKSQIYRDPGTGISFDISKGIENAKPLNFSAEGDPSSVKLDDVKPGDWNTVPEGVRDVAKNIAEYKYPPLSGMALRSPYFQNMFKVISKVDPSFNYQEYQKRQKLLTDFSGEGKMGQNLLAFNTALRHLDTTKKSSDELAKQYDSDQLSNYAVHNMKSMAGNPALNNYETDVNTLINEMGRAVSGGVPNEAEVSRQRETLIGGVGHLRNQAQRDGAMSEMAKLLGGRLGEIQNTYERGFGKKPDVSFLSPEAEDVLKRVGATDLVEKYGSGGGKRPYLDPNTVDATTKPFPGSGAPVNGKLPAFTDQQGKTWVRLPSGEMVPLDQARGGP